MSAQLSKREEAVVKFDADGRLDCSTLQSLAVPGLEGSDPYTVVDTNYGDNALYEFGSAWTQGHRSGMEDAHMAELDFGKDSGMAVFAVFDGHGGKEVADYCASHLQQTLLNTDIYKKGGDIGDALRECFFSLDTKVTQHLSSHIGATATVVVLKDRECIVAGVGDSRCVVCNSGEPQVMTVDHKPDDPQESKRIYKAGGFVMAGRVVASLNVSRALGDQQFKDNDSLPASQQMVSPEPDIRRTRLTDKKEFLVLACDGVWNAMKESEVLQFVMERLSNGVGLEQTARELANECNSLEKTAYDNVTVIIVRCKS